MVAVELDRLRALPQPERTRAERLRTATLRSSIAQLEAERTWVAQTARELGLDLTAAPREAEVLR